MALATSAASLPVASATFHDATAVARFVTRYFARPFAIRFGVCTKSGV